MNASIALLLAQDGITNGAIYALLTLALVLVFAVTRVIFIPQGEFVAYGALSMAAINAGLLPPIMWVVVTLGVAVAIVDSVAAIREGAKSRLPLIILKNAVLPILAVIVVRYLPLKTLAYPIQVLIALGFVVPLGPQIYRLAFQPVAEASVLLLIVAVAVHFVMVGMGLYFFGAEGGRIAGLGDDAPLHAVLGHPTIKERLREGLIRLKQQGGGSTYLVRAPLLADQPSSEAGELTDKGYINQRAVLTRRTDMVVHLYFDIPDSDVITLG